MRYHHSWRGRLRKWYAALLSGHRRPSQMDRLNRERRSWNMSRIGGKNTSPELEVRSLLHRLGFRFRLHRRDLPGTPDIVLPKYHVAIFVHGCFWHGHDCPLFRLPATRPNFWTRKIEQNKARDMTVLAETLLAGWRHLTIWECSFRGPKQIGLDRAVARTVRWLKGRRRICTIRSRK